MDISSKKSKKRSLGTQDKVDGIKRSKTIADTRIDYISDLPEQVLHQILSLLHPRDAARTCILSKRWWGVWNSYQVLDFDLRSFHKMQKDAKANYKNMMNQMLKCREEQFLNINKFRLRFTISKDLIEDLVGWVTSVIKRNVRDLEIQAKPFKSLQFCLPLCVMRGTSISTLNLYNCILPTSEINLDLPQLQKLSLKKMNIIPKLLANFFSSCPLIDELRLIECCGFKKLIVCTTNRLKRLDVHKCRGLRNISVEDPKLESFWLFYDNRKLGQINLSACRFLKDLVLEYARMTSEVFQDLIMEFPLLEKLVLSRCHALKRIEFGGNKLRELVIRRCRKLVQVLVNAPNLVTLEYQGRTMPFSFIPPPSLKEGLLCFEHSSKSKVNWKADESCRIRAFFDDHDRLKGLKLMTLAKGVAGFYEESRVMFNPLHHINKTHSVKLSARPHDLLAEALDTWPYPSTLSVHSYRSSEFPEVIYQELKIGKRDPKCCEYFKNKCWRHYLKGISIEKQFPEASSWSEGHLNVDWQKTIFTLAWNTDKQGRRKEKQSKHKRDCKSTIN